MPILSGTDTQGALSVSALETLWVQNETQLGVPLATAQATAPQAAAVSTAEASRVPDNTNVNTDGSVDYGLFQINTVQNPAFAGQVDPNNIDQSAIFIPNVNVADAATLSTNGTNWGPWSSSEFSASGWGTPGTAAYAIAQAGYQGGAVTPAATGSSSATAPASGSTTTTTTTTPYDPTGIVSEISHLGSDWNTFWANHPVAILIAAGIILIVAIAFIASDKGVQGAATKVAATAAEAA